ncbi:(deoxy)nucleoside triphosphate pyrophosphohydrolase [Candidatus Micrarchaeota archaeon]|nr:(deoxy)nucleoside triphosphate pyrophosphohydrolase [Candidatus Micrarchaeota archaeon]
MTVLVTAAIIQKDDKFLIAQRKADSTFEAGKWEFPGGKVEFLEHPEQSLHREILEELNITIKIHGIFEVASHVYGKDHHVVVLAFLARFHSGELKNLDVQDSRWVTLEELKTYSFAAADIPILDKLTKLGVDLKQ